jgi:hypothetical protein
VKFKFTAIMFAASLAACSSVPVATPPAAPPPAKAPAADQVWESPAAEFPAMCMVFQADGVLAFRGGFAFYNPSNWKRGSNGELMVTLGGDGAFPTEVMREVLAQKNGGLVAFEEKARSIVYKTGTEYLNFGNFYFYPVERCHAAQ